MHESRDSVFNFDKAFELDSESCSAVLTALLKENYSPDLKRMLCVTFDACKNPSIKTFARQLHDELKIVYVDIERRYISNNRRDFWVHAYHKPPRIFFNGYEFDVEDYKWRRMSREIIFGNEFEYDEIDEDQALKMLGMEFGEFPPLNNDALNYDKDIIDFRQQSENIQRAYKIALEAYKNHKPDKGSNPYINHPLTVVSNVGEDESAIKIALLHDVVEDNPDYTFEILQAEANLSTDELYALKLVTHQKNISTKEYLAEIENITKARKSANIIAAKVKQADLIHNSDFSRIPYEKRSDNDYARVKKYRKALEILRNFL